MATSKAWRALKKARAQRIALEHRIGLLQKALNNCAANGEWAMVARIALDLEHQVSVQAKYNAAIEAASAANEAAEEKMLGALAELPKLSIAD